MLKLLIFGLIAVYAWRRWVSPSHVHPPQASHRYGHQPQSVNMVRCQQCGVYVPRDEACGDEAAWFCSAEHQQAYRHEAHRNH